MLLNAIFILGTAVIAILSTLFETRQTTTDGKRRLTLVGWIFVALIVVTALISLALASGEFKEADRSREELISLQAEIEVDKKMTATNARIDALRAQADKAKEQSAECALQLPPTPTWPATPEPASP